MSALGEASERKRFGLRTVSSVSLLGTTWAIYITKHLVLGRPF